MRTRVFAALSLAALPLAFAQTAPKPPSSLRLYVIDCGTIKGLSPTDLR